MTTVPTEINFNLEPNKSEMGFELNITPGGGSGAYTDVDSAQSETSINPVQNRIITRAQKAKAEAGDIPTQMSQLTDDVGYLTEAEIETKADRKEIPTQLSELENDAGYLVVNDLVPYATKDELPKSLSQLDDDVGYLKEHQDISMKADKKDIPTVVSALTNDAGYQTAHQDISGKADVDELPTKVSQLENDTGYLVNEDVKAFITKDDIPTRLSQFTNDVGFLSNVDLSGKADIDDIPTKVSSLENDIGYQTAHQDISGKQDVLTFDTAPTQGSTNPVTSGGVYAAIQNVQPDTSGILEEANRYTDMRIEEMTSKVAEGQFNDGITLGLNTGEPFTISAYDFRRLLELLN